MDEDYDGSENDDGEVVEDSEAGKNDSGKMEDEDIDDDMDDVGLANNEHGNYL
jgi:hypothetical protein